MGTLYATVLVGGDVPNYEDDATITDDGSETEGNRVKYSTITTDLTSPLHVAIQSMDAKLLLQTDEGPLAKAANFPTTTAEHNKVIECTGSITITLLAPASNAGYQTTVKNAGSGVVTIDVTGGANIDGAASIELGAGASRKCYVNSGETAYYSTAGQQFDSDSNGVKLSMLFYNDFAPVGWTIAAALDEHAITLTKGLAASGVEGGTAGGTNDFSGQFADHAAKAALGVAGYELQAADIPAHTHGASGSHGHAIKMEAGAGTDGTNADSMTTGASIWGGSGSTTSNTNLITGTGAHTHTSVGGGGEHGHTLDMQLKWAACIVATKD